VALNAPLHQLQFIPYCVGAKTVALKTPFCSTALCHKALKLQMCDTRMLHKVSAAGILIGFLHTKNAALATFFNFIQ
jgi:hypothetical protein